MVLQSESGDYILGTEKQIRSALNSHPTEEVKFELANGHIAFWFKSTALIYSPPIYQLALPQQQSSGVHHILSTFTRLSQQPPLRLSPYLRVTTRAYIRYNLPYILCLRLHTTRLMRKNGIEIRIKDEVDDERGQRRGVSYSFMDVIITLCLHCLHTLLILIRVGWHFVPSGSWGRRQGCLLWNIINRKLLLQFTEACGTGRPGLFEWPQMDNNNSKWTCPHT